jgi:coenzyme F420 hydrogenase subunit beta
MKTKPFGLAVQVRALLDSVGRHTWSDSEIKRYLGAFDSICSSYALDDQFRTNATSGGSVTAFFDYLLLSGQIKGALVLQSYVEQGVLKQRFIIAEDRSALLAAQGSKYMSVSFGRKEIELLSCFSGPVAVVLLPCDAAKLCRYLEKDPKLREKVKLIVGLFCGHNSEPELTVRVIDSLRRKKEELVNFRYRSGRWLGCLKAEFSDGISVSASSSRFLDYHSLYFLCQTKCFSCHDHFSYYSDISAGDIWNLSRRNNDYNTTALICRTKEASRMIREAAESGVLWVQGESAEEILDGQSRTLPIHYNTSAKSKAGRLFGLRIKDSVSTPVTCRMYIRAFLTLLNYEITRTEIGRRFVFALPRPIIRFYLYLFKLLELFK